MSKQIFHFFIEGIYRKHDRIQQDEEERLKQISVKLDGLDKNAFEFEKRMETVAEEIECFIKKNEENNSK